MLKRFGEGTAGAAKPHEPAYAEPEGRSVEVGAARDGLDHESSVCIGWLCGAPRSAIDEWLYLVEKRLRGSLNVLYDWKADASNE